MCIHERLLDGCALFGDTISRKRVTARNMYMGQEMPRVGMKAACKQWATISDCDKDHFQRLADKWNDDVTHDVNPRSIALAKRARLDTRQEDSDRLIQSRDAIRALAILDDASHIDPHYVFTLDSQKASELSWCSRCQFVYIAAALGVHMSRLST